MIHNFKDKETAAIAAGDGAEAEGFELKRTAEFDGWLTRLRDGRARARIGARLDRLATTGHFGDVRAVGEGVHELRLDFGPGYRLYFANRAGRVILLLVGGDKDDQARDIIRAKALAAEVGGGNG